MSTRLPAKLSQPLGINVTLLDNRKRLIAAMNNTNIQAVAVAIDNPCISITYLFAKRLAAQEINSENLLDSKASQEVGS